MESKVVVILENDREVLDVLYLILSKQHEVHLFTEPPVNFLSLIETKKPDLIIIDWLIPNIRTEDLIAPIRIACDDNIKIIVTSAHASVEVAFSNLPVDAILKKPFGAYELKQVICNLFSEGEIKSI